MKPSTYRTLRAMNGVELALLLRVPAHGTADVPSGDTQQDRGLRMWLDELHSREFIGYELSPDARKRMYYCMAKAERLIVDALSTAREAKEIEG